MMTPQSLIEGIQEQGRWAYRALLGELGRMEKRLEGLRAQTDLWRSALPGGSKPPAKRGKVSAPRRAAKRVAKQRRSPSADWDAVLKRLPKTFSVKDLERRTPTTAKDPEARARALARWARTKQVKKLGKDKYQRARA